MAKSSHMTWCDHGLLEFIKMSLLSPGQKPQRDKNLSFCAFWPGGKRDIFINPSSWATSGVDGNDMNEKSTVKDILSSGHIHTLAYSMTVLCWGWAWRGGAIDSCCSHLIFNSAVDGLLLLADDDEVLLCVELGVGCDDVLEPERKKLYKFDLSKQTSFHTR